MTIVKLVDRHTKNSTVNQLLFAKTLFRDSPVKTGSRWLIFATDSILNIPETLKY